MRTIALSRGWAFDTDTKLTQAAARAILLSPFPTGGLPRVALIRYLSLVTPSPRDLDIPERDAIFAAGWPAIGLVQHVNYPSWQADSRIGSQHGASAAHHAQLIEAPPGTDITPDIEGLGNSGAQAYDYLAYWADEVRDAGYSVRPYDGYDDGLPDVYKTLLLTRGIVAANKWWSDFGPRSLPPPEMFSMKQHTQITLGGTKVDPNQVLLDGVVMCFGPDPATVPTIPPPSTPAAA